MSMKLKLAVAIQAALLLGVQAYAAPLKTQDVAENAKWLVHVDVECVINSELGKHLFDQTNLPPKAKVGLSFIKGLFGVDLLKDISGVTVYSSGPKEEDGVLIVRGPFSPEQTLNLLKLSGGYECVPFGSRSIHKGVDEKKGKPFAVCFLESGAAVLSSSAEKVQAAVDVVDGKLPCLKPSGDLKIPESAGGMLLVATKDKVGFGEMAKTAVLQKSGVSGNLFLAEVSGCLELGVQIFCDSPETAAQIEQVVRGMMAGVALAKDKNPELAEIVGGMSVKNEGGAVSAKISCPVAKAFDFIKAQEAKEKLKAAKPAAAAKGKDALPGAN